MVSMVPAGAADRIAARSFFNALRAGSGTAARYSSTLAGFAVAERRVPRLASVLRSILLEPCCGCSDAALFAVLLHEDQGEFAAPARGLDGDHVLVGGRAGLQFDGLTVPFAARQLLAFLVAKVLAFRIDVD